MRLVSSFSLMGQQKFRPKRLNVSPAFVENHTQSNDKCGEEEVQDPNFHCRLPHLVSLLPCENFVTHGDLRLGEDCLCDRLVVSVNRHGMKAAPLSKMNSPMQKSRNTDATKMSGNNTSNMFLCKRTVLPSILIDVAE